MAKIIAFTNQKGGVGKTTTACAFASMFASKGKRVLAVDLDPQGNLSFTFGAHQENLTIHDVLLGKASIHEAIVTTNTCDVIPANILLSGLDLELKETGREFTLKNKLSSLLRFYDYIIVDTPPALNLLTINAYTAADHLIIPMTAEILSLQGVSQIKDTIFAVKKFFNKDLDLKGILLTKYNSRALLSKEVWEMASFIAKQLDTIVINAKISNSVSAAEAPAHCQSVVTYEPNCAASKDYFKAAKELYPEVFLSE